MALAIAALLSAQSAVAHELRPAYLELRETTPGVFRVLWKTPALGQSRLALAPTWSATVEATAVTTEIRANAAVQHWTLRTQALRGQTLRIAGLENTMTDALARIEFSDATSWTHRFTPQRPEAVIPPAASGVSTAVTFLGLGIEHIATGADHLLFVLALILITNGGWRTVKTITAFTLAHALTLTLAAVGVVHVPPQPVEALIALSIVFAAGDVVHAKRGRATIGTRAPWVTALSFGLLHGLGFAGGLSEIGLPPQHIPLALLFFSLGVEAGHLVFVTMVLTVLAAVRRWRGPSFERLNWMPSYAIGGVAAFWLVQRIAAF